MSDCFWGHIEVCKCKGMCEKYLSINSWKCEEIEERYFKDVEEALKPVREKYRVEFGNYINK